MEKLLTAQGLLDDLRERGMLTKEAAAEIAELRAMYLKKTLEKTASDIFKSAGLFSSGLDAAQQGRGLKGFLSGFRHGGLGPAKDRLATTTGWGDVASNLAKMIGLAALVAGATGGTSALLKHQKDKSLQKDIKESYRQMFKEMPRVQDLYEKDPHRVDSFFQILAKYAPSMAANPIVAGTFVQETSPEQRIGADTLKMLSEVQNRIDENARTHPGGEHLDRGVTMAARAMNPFGSGGGLGKP